MSHDEPVQMIVHPNEYARRAASVRAEQIEQLTDRIEAANFYLRHNQSFFQRRKAKRQLRRDLATRQLLIMGELDRGGR